MRNENFYKEIILKRRKMKKLSSIAMIAALVVLNYTATMAQSSADKPPPTSSSSPNSVKKPPLTITKGQILSNMKITFLGIDLTDAKFVGSYEVWKSVDEVKGLNPQWNQLMVSEADKYNLRKAFRRDDIEYKVDICIDHNNGLNYDDRITMTSEDKPLSDQEIQNIVSNYDFKDLTGLGLMFMIESFDKTRSEGTMDVVFVNLNTQEVVYTERLSGPSAGFGLRNHWARSILEVILQIEKKRYKAWQKQFGS